MSDDDGRYGRTVRQDGYDAFIPAPKPAEFIEWTPSLVSALSRADRETSRLAGKIEETPRAKWAAQPFLRREAVFSSRIENIHCEPRELLASEAASRIRMNDTGEADDTAAKTTASRGGPSDDLSDTANCARALNYVLERARYEALSVELFLNAHRILMASPRNSNAQPGEFRTVQNWIGTPGSTPRSATYVPPAPEAVHECMHEWEKMLLDNSLPALMHAALAHAQFEAIHPFVDGNGRIGRIAIAAMLYRREVFLHPVLQTSEALYTTRESYYEHLQGTRQGRWNAWSEYFLHQVRRGAENATARLDLLSRATGENRNRVGRTRSVRIDEAINILRTRPFWTTDQLAVQLHTTTKEATRIASKLHEAGVLTHPKEPKWHGLHCAENVLQALI